MTCFPHDVWKIIEYTCLQALIELCTLMVFEWDTSDMIALLSLLLCNTFLPQVITY